MPFQLIVHCMHCKSLQSCLALCNHINHSPPGSSFHGLLRQEYWSGLPSPSPGALPNPGIEPASKSPALALYHQHHLVSTIYMAPITSRNVRKPVRYLVSTISATFRETTELGVVKSIAGQRSKFWMVMCMCTSWKGEEATKQMGRKQYIQNGFKMGEGFEGGLKGYNLETSIGNLRKCYAMSRFCAIQLRLELGPDCGGN